MESIHDVKNTEASHVPHGTISDTFSQFLILTWADTRKKSTHVCASERDPYERGSVLKSQQKFIVASERSRNLVIIDIIIDSIVKM